MRPVRNIFCCLLMLIPCFVLSQNVSFALKSGPNVNFAFTTVQDYQTGRLVMDAVTLNIDVSGTNWDLYVGASTALAGQWDVVSTYSSTYGILPGIDILELRFRNMANTSQVVGFFNLTDILTPVYVIGSAALDAPVNCPLVGTNTPGSFLINPNCYQFKVDMRITPGFDMRPGLYTLRVDYILIQDL